MSGAVSEFATWPSQEKWREPWLALGDLFEREKREQRAAASKGFRAIPRSDTDFLDALHAYCGFHTWIQTPLLPDFGRWLLERVPVEKWTPEQGRDMWSVWEAGALKGAPITEPAKVPEGGGTYATNS